MFGLGTGELIVIVLIVLLLFGGRKIPEVMRGLGNGLREFKKASQDATSEIKKAVDDADTAVKCDPPAPSTDEKA